MLEQESPKHGFSQAWSSDGAHSLPGGSYKMTNTQTFPGTSLTFSHKGLCTHWKDEQRNCSTVS